MYDYDFNIPNDATINGIEVRLDTYATLLGGTISVRLSKNNCSTLVGTAKSFTATTSETTRTLGSSIDLWGTTWNATLLEAREFCVNERSPTLLFPEDEIREDFVRVMIYYTVPVTEEDKLFIYMNKYNNIPIYNYIIDFFNYIKKLIG
jgi:hypothetical protein